MQQAIAHPGWPQARMHVEILPEEPDSQVSAVIARMCEYARTDSESPYIRAAVHQAAAEFPSADIAESIFEWIKSRVSFHSDETRGSELGLLADQTLVEVLIRPADLVIMRESAGCRRMGDCDDFSMLAASMLLAAGRPACFVTVAVDPSSPGRFSHVYVETVDVHGRRMPLDCSHGSYPRWEVGDFRPVYRTQKWPVDSAIPAILLGLGLLAAYKYKLWRM